MQGAQLANRTLFVICTIVTGALAGAFVWLFFFLMNKGLGFIWITLPAQLNFAFFPLVVCTVGGVIIGLYEKRFGSYPEELNVVMAKVKEEGRYDYHDIGVSSVAARSVWCCPAPCLPVKVNPKCLWRPGRRWAPLCSVMLLAAALGSAIPLPKAFRPETPAQVPPSKGKTSDA